MSQKLYPTPESFAAHAHVTRAHYNELYAESLRDPEQFWSRMGHRLQWRHPYSKVKDVSFQEADFRIRWYYDGRLNVAENCLDRHLAIRGNKTAIIWEGD